MTLEPAANQEDVYARSGQLGFSAIYAFEMPAHHSTETTGGSDISHDQDGFNATLGATAGDTVAVETQKLAYSGANASNVSKSIRWLGITPRQSSYSDAMEVGAVRNTIDNTNGHYIDFNNDQYWADGNTQALGWTYSNGDRMVLKIISDHKNNQTTFDVRGANEETVTLSGGSNMMNSIIRGESNGNGDQFKIEFVNQIVVVE